MPVKILKRLVGPSLLTAAAATQYTAPNGHQTIIREILVSNPTASSQTFTISLGVDAVGTRIFSSRAIRAKEQFRWYGYLPLASGEVVQAFSGTTSVLNLTIDGYEAITVNVTTTTTTTSTTTTTTTTSTTSTTTTTTTTASPSNEPLGSSLIDDYNFSSVANSSSGTVGRVFTPQPPNSTSGISVETDATAPISPSSVGSANYPAGMGSGVAPSDADFTFVTAYSTVYTRHSLLYSSNFEGHDTGQNKSIHFWINGSNRIFTTAHNSGGASNGALEPRIGLQGLGVSTTVNGVTGTQFDFVAANVDTSKRFIRGQWHVVETIWIANTSGVANGSIQMWVDGIKTHNYTAIGFTASGGTSTWTELKWNPTWGGGGANTVDSNMYIRMDHLYISGKN